MNTDKMSDKKAASKNEGFDFNIKEMLFRYLHFSWLFALVLSISLMCAWLYLRYTPSKYRVAATMLIRNPASSANADLFSGLMMSQDNINTQNEIQILKSRAMMTRVVDSLGLQYSYYVMGNVKTTDLYREAPFALEFLSAPTRPLQLEIHFKDENTFRIGESPTEYTIGQPIKYLYFEFRLVPRESSYSKQEFKDYIASWQPLESAAMGFLGGLEVKSTEASSMLELSYVTENPRLGADIINTLMVEYNKAAIEDKNQINRNILAFIDDRLKLVESQLDSVERDLQRFKTGKKVIDLSSQSSIYFGNILETNKAIREEEVQIGVIELMENYLSSAENKLTLVPSTLGIQDPTLLQFTANYNKLINDRATQLQTGATINSPAVKNIEADIEQARLKLLQNLANIKAAHRSAINSLRLQNKSFSSEIANIPEKERENRDRERQQESKQNLYLYLLQKKEESAIAEASTIANSRVLDHALPTHVLVSPIPARIYSIAALAGLIIPIIIVYVLYLLNDKISVKSDIINATETPILGEIGHCPAEKKLLFPERSRSVVAEQLRIMRTNLKFVMGEQIEKPVIMITSSFSGEGKSFISTNLAAAMAVSGKRTVVLEFDLRKPKILAGLGLSKGKGLTNYLVGSAYLEQLPQSVPEVENLFVISCGPVPPNPAEILLTKRVGELFSWLREKFDVVIVDTAPVGLVSDAITLSQFADATLYVVRQRYTFKRQLGFVNDLYHEKKLPNMGLVVNDVVAKGAASYYGYGGGRYSYGYGYGHGLSNGYYEEEKNAIWKTIKRRFVKKS